MAAKLLLTKPELDTIIGRLENSASNLDTLLAKLNGIMDQLSVDWAGAAQMAYKDAYEEIETRSLLPVKQLLESYPETLRQVEQEIDFQDGDNAASIRSQYGGLLHG